jgi:heme/copper-type cytochrome/quinol oxidase subunit 1
VGRPIFYIGYWEPEPKYSVCPYCAGKHKDFAPADKPMRVIITVVGAIFIIGMLTFLGTQYYEWNNRPPLHERSGNFDNERRSILNQMQENRSSFDQRRQDFERRHQAHMERFRERHEQTE